MTNKQTKKTVNVNKNSDLPANYRLIIFLFEKHRSLKA